MQADNKSDIARIRENIEAECQALNNLSLFSSTASHSIINGRFKALDMYHLNNGGREKVIAGREYA